MKYILVLALLQKASASSTTGAPSPSIPAAGGAAVVISGNFVAGFGTCVNAKKCTQACTNKAMQTLQSQGNLPSLPTGTATTPGCPRRLSESELSEIFSRIRVTPTRRLATGDVQFAYSFTATANQQSALTSTLSNMGSGAAATSFLAALKTAVAAAGLGIDTTSMTIKSFSTPASTPSTTASQVSAAVGSQATLPAVALLFALFWKVE